MTEMSLYSNFPQRYLIQEKEKKKKNGAFQNPKKFNEHTNGIRIYYPTNLSYNAHKLI